MKKETKGNEGDKIMRKGILIGIGIFVILLALAGTGSARTVFSASCNCHTSIPALNVTGSFFNDTHKFNGISVPTTIASCTKCHVDPTNANYNLISNGSFYNSTHRYNVTTLASVKLIGTTNGCNNCHNNTVGGYFDLISGAATYLGSTICEDCHKAKYDNWTNTMHRVMLTKNTSGAVMNLTVPDGKNWTTTNVSYMVVGKTSFRYLNATGYLFKKYDVVNQIFSDYNITDPTNRPQYSCGGCHTTGYNATGGNQSGLPGIVGTWAEEGIACEECHGPGGNGHNVTVDPTGQDCLQCHDGNSRQGQAKTSGHFQPPAFENGACASCHSPYDKYQNKTVLNASDAVNITCSVCHNPHSTTDNKYAGLLSVNGFSTTTYSVVEDVKLSFFNGTASNASKQAGSNASLTAGNDVYDNLSLINILLTGIDASYNGSINLTGRPISEKLCSMCHYNHGLAHIGNVNLTHGRNNLTNSSEWATCTDCHMSGSEADHSFDVKNETNYPENTCSKGTNCHVTSNQSRLLSNLSIVPVEREWNESVHNDRVVGIDDPADRSFYFNYTTNTVNKRDNDCLKCHSPFDWSPQKAADATAVNLSSTFKGITCDVCHDIHDMGDSINKSEGRKYAWYNRDATPSYSKGVITRYKANYSRMTDTIELCGNCHSNDNPRRYKLGPGWNKTTDSTPISPHGFPAKDIFVGSWKQSGILKFECIDCHMYINKTNATGGIANDSEKITGHSFAVNSTGLQNKSECSGCHVNQTSVDTIENLVAKIKADTHTKWNSTNTTVMAALGNYTSYQGLKTMSADKIAGAYWNLRMVSSDGSWGVHDPTGTNKLLDDAIVLANAADASLGQGLSSSVSLKAGWNLVALNTTPAVTTSSSVMSSVEDNITVVWGYNAGSVTKWELYDPLMPSGLNSLKNIVRGQGYWIYAKVDCVWTV